MQRSRCWNIALSAFLLLASIATHAGAPASAPIMPLASRSLLLDIAPAGERLVVVGERGHILSSQDGGNSWQQAVVPTIQMLTAVYFIDDQRGWAVGHDGLILVSDDSGTTWRIQRDGLATQQQANIEAREAAYQQVERLQQALESADPGDLEDLQLRLDDARMDLEDADLDLAEAVFTSPLMDIWFQDRQRGWAVGAFGTLLWTRNGGQSWSNDPELVDNPDEFHLNAITGDVTGRVFIAGEGGGMYRSLDSGQSWQALEPFYEGSWFGTVYSAQHDALLVFGLRGNLYRSDNFGDSWEAVAGDNNVTLAGGSTSADGDIVLAGGVGTVLHSSDGGLTFERHSLADRLSLSSAISRDGRLILLGQGGVKTLEDGHDNE